MKIKEIFSLALWNTFKNFKFIVLLWFSNAALAFVLAVPIYALLIDNLQHSVLSDQLAVQFDYLWFIQFISIYKNTISHLPLLTYTIVVIYLIIQSFYLGGMISVLNNIEKNHISDFFYGGVKYFFRFIKVLLIALIFIALAFIINDLIGDLIEYLFRDYDYQLTDFILRSLRYLLLILLLGIVFIISDYTRLEIAITDNSKVFSSIYNAVILIKNNFSLIFIVFLIIAVLGAIGAVIYNIVEIFVPSEPYPFLILSFILQQLLIIFRLLIRMLFVSTEIIIYKDLSADFINAEINESKVGVN